MLPYAEPDFRPGLAALLDQAMIRPATPEEGLPLRLVAAERALEAMTAKRDRYKAALNQIAELPFQGPGSTSWRLIAERALDEGQTDD